MLKRNFTIHFIIFLELHILQILLYDKKCKITKEHPTPLPYHTRPREQKEMTQKNDS